MKVAVLSDIHGNFPALQAVLRDLKGNADKMVFLGDICGYYPFVQECLDALAEWEFVGVRGNHDQVLLDALDRGTGPGPAYESKYGTGLRRGMQDLDGPSKQLLRDLPPSRSLNLVGLNVALAHGAPWDPLEGRVYPDFQQWERFRAVDADVVLLGQTHHAMVKRFEGRLVVNPGSVGQPRDGVAGACHAVLDLPSGGVEHKRTRYDPTPLIEDAQKHDPGVPYLQEVLRR